MNKFALIILLAISASCTKATVQVIPDEFIGTYRGYDFHKVQNGDGNALLQNEAVKFEIRPDGTYTRTTYHVNPSMGLVIPMDDMFRVTSVEGGTVKTVKDSINFSSHYNKTFFKVQIQIGMYHEYINDLYYMLLKKDNFKY